MHAEIEQILRSTQARATIRLLGLVVGVIGLQHEIRGHGHFHAGLNTARVTATNVLQVTTETGQIEVDGVINVLIEVHQPQIEAVGTEELDTGFPAFAFFL